MNHRVVIPVVVVARMSSTRLPGKSLKQITGETVVGRVVSNVARSKSADAYLVATSIDPTDTPIMNWCREQGVPVFRGPLDNVALRVLQAGVHARADAVVRVSGDSPFIDPVLIDHAIRLYRANDLDLVTNVFPRSFPRGQSVEVISLNALRRVIDNGLTAEQQEHVTKAFYDHPHDFHIANFATEDVGGTCGDHSSIQLAIDSEGDWVTAMAVAEMLGPRLVGATWLEVESAWLHLTKEQES